MVLGNRTSPKTPLGVFRMAALLVIAAFIGATAGLIWQSLDWFSEPEEEVLTAEGAAG